MSGAGTTEPGAPDRPAVHAVSGKRLGASHPRQEGATDLRLVPPALAAWATAALTVHVSGAWVTGLVVVCLAGAAVLLLMRWRGAHGVQRGAPSDGGVGGEGAVVGAPVASPGRRRGDGVRGPSGAWPQVSAAAVLLCVAAAATSAGVHGADLRRGPVPDLARQYARITAEVQLTS
ncbi:hypothetical protein ABZS63_32585, partial [Streptomyces sp. NPDC005568]